MSHLTSLDTKIRSADLLEDALKACNVAYQRGPGLQVRGMGNQRQDVEIRLDLQPASREKEYNIGFFQNAEGTYTAAADWDYNKGGVFKDLHIQRVKGVARFGRIEQEYVLIVADLGARERGMVTERTQAADGVVTMRITGGSLRSTEAIILIAHPNGNVSVSAENFEGPSCIEATEWLNDYLGTATEVTHLPDFFHEKAADGTVRHAQHVNV